MTRPARPLGLAVLLMPVALVAACSQGYPSDNAPIASPFDMNQAQRIAALNVVGSEADDARRWRYTLEEGCVLAVRQHEGWWRQSSIQVPLDGVSLETRVPPGGNGSGLKLVASGPDVASVTLLHSDNPLPAQQANLLVKLIKRDCDGAPSS